MLCWEAFRTGNTDLRGVSALNAEVLSVVSLTVQLAMGVLDPSSSFARMFAGPPGDQTARSLFILPPFGALQYGVVHRRANCPMCGVGPAPSRQEPAPRPEPVDDWVEAVTQAVERQPATSAAIGAAALVVFLVALGTGSFGSIFLLTVALIGGGALLFRPNLEETLAMVQARPVLPGLSLGLFLAAVATGEAMMVLLFTIALMSCVISLLRPRQIR